MNPPSLLCRKAKVRSWGGSCPWPFYPMLRTLHCTTLPKHAKTPHQARDHDDASWTNAVWSSDNWGWKYLRKHGYEWVRTELLRGCPACYILRSFTQPHGRFAPASPACPSKSFSCSSVTLHIARSKKPGSSWQYIQPFGKLLISSLTSSKEMLSDNLSYISSAKQGFYDHQIGNCMKLQPHQPHQPHQPLLEDFQRRVCSYPLYLSAAAPWDVQTCDVHPINSHSAPVPGSFCMLLATSASHPAQTRCI